MDIHSTRIQALQKLLVREHLDALLIKDPINRFYLTGFDSSAGILCVSRRHAQLLVDGRYHGLAKKQVASSEVSLYRDLTSLVTLCKKKGYATIGLEMDQFGIIFQRAFKKETGKHLLLKGGMVESLRTVKSEDEIARLRKASALTDAIFNAAKRKIRLGMTEREVQILFKRVALDHNVLDWSFAPIIAFNAHAAYPHYMLHDDRVKLKRGDTILVDMGCPYQSYQSDMTRMLFVGEVPSKIAQTYSQLLCIQEAAIKMVKPGQSIQAMVASFEQEMRQAKLLAAMNHSLGHGVGLNVHELPVVSSSSRATFQPGMVITIEPGVYYDGKFGLRIEDTCLVTERGALSLNKVPKDLPTSILPV